MRTVEGSSGVYAAAVVGWYVCVRSVKVIQYMIYGTREHMCCRDLQFQCCAAVSVFLSFSGACLHYFHSSCMLVCQYDPGAKHGFSSFLLQPNYSSSPVYVDLCMCVCARVCL